MVIRLLTSAERETLRPIYETEFNSELPPEQQANIVGVIENEKIEAFVTTEVLLRVGLLWVSPEAEKPSSLIRDLTRHLIVSIPKGSSVVALTTTGVHERFFSHLGFYKCDGTLYRTDV
jgi:hypothetical protein